MKKLFTSLIVAVALANVSVAESYERQVYNMLNRYAETTSSYCDEQTSNNMVEYSGCYAMVITVFKICVGMYAKAKTDEFDNENILDCVEFMNNYLSFSSDIFTKYGE